jgi:hypothetical protein
MQQINAQLAGEVTRMNIANAVAVKQANISKQVGQVAIQLVETAAQVGSGQTPGRGIDVKA